MAPAPLAAAAIDLPCESVASRPMIKFLARAAEQAREAAGRKRYHVAAELSIDPSTVYRFEKGQWPQRPDDMIEAYASDLRIESIEIWERALQMWRDELDAGAEDVSPRGTPQGLAAEAADAAEALAERARRTRDSSGRARPGQRRRRA